MTTQRYLRRFSMSPQSTGGVLRGIAAVVFAVALSPAIGCEDAPPEPDPTPEPLNGCEVDLVFDVDTALPLNVGEDVLGTLCPARDADWYRFSVVGEGKIAIVSLSMDTFLTPVEPGYSLLTADGTPLGISVRHPDRSQGEVVNFTGAHALDAGDYVVRVADVEGFDDGFDNDNAFTLNIELTDNPDTNEPNDDIATATTLTPGTPAEGLIATTGDEDWFAFALEEDARIIDVTVTLPVDSGLSLIADLYDATGTNLVATTPLAPETTDATTETARMRTGAAGVAGDRWFVRIRDASGDRAQLDPALGRFAVDVTIVADPDTNEVGGRNDSPATATTVTAGQTLSGFIASRGDNDVFRFDPPAGTGPTPRVLLVTMTIEQTLEIQPQFQIVSADPNDATPDACDTASCLGPCVERGGAPVCGETRFQRLPTQATYSTGFPLRNTDPVFVVINDLFDDSFAETSGYGISFDIIDDTDPGEPDNYLVPSLETRPVGEEQRDDVFDNSVPFARNATDPSLVESCPYVPPVISDGGVVEVDGGPPGTCQPTIPVPVPGQGGQVEYTVLCNGENYSSTVSGRLAYEGDRDFFVFDLPEAGYWSLTANYSVSAPTPIELTVFFRQGNGDVVAAFLETESVQDGCLSTAQCPESTVCIDGKCWRDEDSNPAVNASWPPAGDCFYTHVNDSRPVYIEITDNGVNDFDTAMEYELTLTARCGCPSECDNAFGACQGVAPPP